MMVAGRLLTKDPDFRGSSVLARALPNVPLWPSVHPTPPTLSNGSAGGASLVNGGTVRTTGINGQKLHLSTSASASSGATTLTFSSTTGVVVGMEARHIVANSGIPEDTYVTAVTGTTVTLSKAITGAISSGDRIGFGNYLVSFLGCTPGIAIFGSGPAVSNSCNASGTQPVYAIEFEHYGTDLDFRYIPLTSSVSLWVWLDGQPCTAAPTALSSLSAGSYYRYRMQFNHASDSSARWRRVRIYMQYMAFASLDVAPADAVCKARDAYPKLAFYGDSWVEGALGAVVCTQLIASIVGQIFATIPFIPGQGGTGYIANGGGGNKAAFTDPARLAALIATAADVIFIMGSINDTGQSAAAVQAAAESVIDTIKEGLPRAKIILVGVEPSSGAITSLNSNTNYSGPNDGLKAAAASRNAGFINILEGGLVYGTGYAGATAGDGNADIIIGSDGAHPNPAIGPEFFGRYIAERAFNYLESA